MRRGKTNPRAWNPNTPVLLVPLFLTASLASSVCEGQIVVGHLVETGSGAPVEGALVVLLRESGEEEDGYLTNSLGRFRLKARSRCSYACRVA